MAACPKLTKLTVVYPCLGDGEAETGDHLGLVESVRSATLELVNACKVLPDFDTFQIVHFPLPDLFPFTTWSGTGEPFHRLREDLGNGKDLVINCFKEPETGYQEGEGRKKITVRVIELVRDPPPYAYLHFVKVEVYEV